jgi:hypothetical protein
VTILTISIYGMTKSLGIKFLPFYAWSQFFAALMHMAIAALGLNDYIKYITNFSRRDSARRKGHTRTGGVP